MVCQKDVAHFVRIFVLTTLCLLTVKSSFPAEEQPISITNAITSEEFSVFTGTSSSSPKSHELHDLHGLKKINKYFFVFSRNRIFMVDFPKTIVGKNSKKIIYETYKVELDMDQKSFDTCINHHRKLLDIGAIEEKDCYNHVTTMVEYTDEKTNIPTNKIFVCSSHGAKPKIKTYKIAENGTLKEQNEKSISIFNERGMKLCSAFPSYKTVSLSSYGSIYNGFTHHVPVSEVFKLVADDPDRNLKTYTKNPAKNHIKNPAKFVRIIEGTAESGKVLTFFNEPAIETGDNRYMATVSQVCKNDAYKDVGASSRFQFVFSSFVKVRLSCSIDANPPLYLDQLVSVTGVIALDTVVEGRQKVVFATMKSSSSFINVSSVCMFKVEDINNALESPLMEEVDGFIYPIKNNVHPNISRCDFNVSKSGIRTLNSKSEEFIKSHYMARDRVQSWNFQKPGPLMLSQKDDYTAILIETLEETKMSISSEKLNYIVMWLGTKSGIIIKTLFLTSTDEKIVLERRKVFDRKICNGNKSEVTSLLVDKESGNILVTFNDCIMAVPLCPHIGLDCEQECKTKKDPYCTWDGHLCQGTTVHDISRDQDLDSSERLAKCPVVSAGIPNTSTDEHSKALKTKAINEKSEVEIDQTKVAQAGNEGSIAVLTACIGCFIGIVLTSFIFICCNPCHELTRKRQRHLSTTSGLAKFSGRSQESSSSKSSSLQRINSLARKKLTSESSAKSYVINTGNAVVLDSKKVRHESGENKDHYSSDQNHLVEDFRPKLEKQKSRNISTSSKTENFIKRPNNILLNQTYMRQNSYGNDKQNRQQTLPHPVRTPMKPPHFQRSFSNQQHNRMLHRTASFGPTIPQKVSNHRLGRQHSFQVPNRTKIHDGDNLRFLPSSPVFAPGNIRGPMTPTVTQVNAFVPMTSPSKRMTYSLDRRQTRKMPVQSLQQDFPLYQNLNEIHQRKRYLSESTKPLQQVNDLQPRTQMIKHLPKNYQQNNSLNTYQSGSQLLKNKMSLNLGPDAQRRRVVVGMNQGSPVGTPTNYQFNSSSQIDKRSFAYYTKRTPVSTPLEEESPLLSEASTLTICTKVENQPKTAHLEEPATLLNSGETRDVLGSVGESPSSEEFYKS